MRELTEKQEESLTVVLDYIKETERNSFDQAPSKDHVFYHATLVEDGEDAADDVLVKATLVEDTPGGDDQDEHAEAVVELEMAA
jgi:hypothetical protein